MKVKLLLLCSIVLLLVIGGIEPAHAALSIGPSGAHEKLIPGIQTEHTFYIGRTYPDEVVDFSVELSEGAEEFVDINGQDTFTIERGDYQYLYTITIDSTGLEPGIYEADIRFVQESMQETNAAMAVRYGVQGTIDLEVVQEYAPEDNPTDLHGSGELVADIGILEFESDKELYLSGNTAVFNWKAKNNSESEAFSNVPVEATIFFDGGRVSGMNGKCGDVLSPGEECEGTYQYQIPTYRSGDYSLILNIAGNIETLPFQINTPFYYTNWFRGILIAIGLICLAILFIYSDVCIMYAKYLHEHNKRILRRGAKKMQKIRILRYKKTIGVIIPAILVCGVVGTYLRIPVIESSELEGLINLNDQMVVYVDQVDQGIHMIRPKDLVQDYVEGEWTVYFYSDNRFFLIPQDRENNVYLVNPSIIFQYDYSALPGPIDSVDVNKRQSLMLLQGENEETNKRYYCLSGIGIDDGPQCVFLEDLMDDENVIAQMGWLGDEDVMMIYVDDKQYTYNYWSDQLMVVDQVEEGQEIGAMVFQPAEPILKHDEDWKVFYNIIYNWEQKKAYRLGDTPSLYQLSENHYLTVNEQGELRLLDLEKEKMYFVDQVQHGARLYLVEPGYFITTP